jgi:hypothetical protein
MTGVQSHWERTCCQCRSLPSSDELASSELITDRVSCGMLVAYVALCTVADALALIDVLASCWRGFIVLLSDLHQSIRPDARFQACLSWDPLGSRSCHYAVDIVTTKAK